MALFKKANQANLIFKEGGLLLRKLNKAELQDIVRFLYSVKKMKRDNYPKHSGSMKTMREHTAKIQPTWTK